METITIPLSEYIELLELYRKISDKIQKIEEFRLQSQQNKKIDIWKYCGVISLEEDPLEIQKKMRS